MALFAKTSGEGWSFDKKTGQLTLTGELPVSADDAFHALGKRIRSIVALKGARVIYGYWLFAHLENLTVADLAELDVTACEGMGGMFQGCSSLTTVDLSGWDIRKVKSMSNMFDCCRKLESIKTGPLWIPRLVESTFSMFGGCLSLRELDLSSWHFGSLKDIAYMFSHCGSLEELDLSSMNVSYVEKMSGMFSDCRSLRTLKLGGWNLGNVKEMRELFQNCGKLEILDLTGWHVPSDANTEDMFKGVPGSVQVTASDDSVTRLLPAGAVVKPVGAYKESTKDYRRAMAAIETDLRSAKAGEKNAQFKAGNLYYKGDVRHNIPLSKATAAEWYTKSAAQGHMAAIYKLAYMYDTGDGIPANKAKAEELYRIAARQVMPDNDLGSLNVSGLEIECLMNASAHQIPAAQYMLGELYYRGIMVPQDREKAKELFQKAADNGVEPAKQSLKTYNNKKEKTAVYTIDADLCVRCFLCESTCPVGAISFVSNQSLAIDQEACVGCGACKAGCPVEAIYKV